MRLIVACLVVFCLGCSQQPSPVYQVDIPIATESSVANQDMGNDEKREDDCVPHWVMDTGGVEKAQMAPRTPVPNPFADRAE